MPFGIGPVEVIVVLVIALLIFGPKRLPDLGRSLGGGMREFKNSVSGSERDESSLAPVNDGVAADAPRRHARDEHLEPAAPPSSHDSA